MAWSDERRINESRAGSLLRRGTHEQADGNLEKAEALFRDALRALETATTPDHVAFINVSSAFGQLLIDRGAYEEAESLLTTALDLTKTAAGAHDDQLPILLRELSRLYILQDEYQQAERPLFRLLALTEAQGQSRPEVATVLASLAAVRHALGDYASAEQMYREALIIREKTLSPNHITTAATMESLAETCAARGRFTEAVTLCNRSLSIRETTLGADDASVRVARKRIADLQLEAQEESRVTTPPRSAPALQLVRPAEPPPLEQKSTIGASRLPAVLIPTWTSPAVIEERTPWRNTVATAVQRRSFMRTAIVSLVVVAVAVLGIRSRLGNTSSTFDVAGPFNPVEYPGSPPVTAVVPQRVAPAPLDTQAISPRRAADTVAPRVVARATPPKEVVRERPRTQAPPTTSPVVAPPKSTNAIAPAAPRTDVVPTVRAGSVPAAKVIDSTPPRATPPPVVVEKAPEPRVRGETANAPTSPTLIGSAPQPQYPEALRDQQVEGEVVVQFVVDETGRVDVSSMTVVRSPHVLLTNAVRAVLPQFKYEPARTAPPQSTPRPETVRYAHTFRAPRR
ncbi:MAG: TonB family protein [bacterium]